LRAGSYVRHQFAGESINGFAIVGLYCNPQNRFFNSLGMRRIFLVEPTTLLSVSTIVSHSVKPAPRTRCKTNSADATRFDLALRPMIVNVPAARKPSRTWHLLERLRVRLAGLAR
jgi:hypothetical protein